MSEEFGRIASALERIAAALEHLHIEQIAHAHIDDIGEIHGDVNWKDGDEIEVCLGGTFAGDKFIAIHNRTRSNTTKK